MEFEAYSDSNHRQAPSQLQLYVLRKAFAALFPHGWDFIEKETPESDWKTVKKYKLTSAKLWYKLNDPKTTVGVRFGTKTRYGMYDLDWGSAYHPAEQEASLRALQGELEQEWGISRVIVLQSSISCGLHIYFFLSRAVSSFRLACAMNWAAERAGLEIKRGQLETFPNTKNYDCIYNGHRLPLQQGSFLLDKDYMPYSNSLESFVSAAEWSVEGNDVDLLEGRLEEAYDWFKVKRNQERWYEPTPEDREFVEQVEYCQREISEGFLGAIRLEVDAGFSGHGETNELLLAIAKLGRIAYGHSGQRYIEYIKETVMACPGYAKYCRHQHEIDKRCAQVARFGEKQWFPYRTRMEGKNRYTYEYVKSQLAVKPNLNSERQHNARSRIIQAVQHIQEREGGLSQKVGECKLAIRNITKELFGVSVSDATLKKPENIGLWHPKYRDAEVAGEASRCSEAGSIVEEYEEIEDPWDIEDFSSPDNQPSEPTFDFYSTLEPDELEVSDTLNELQQSSNEGILRPMLPPESTADKQRTNQSRPLRVVRDNEVEAESPKAKPSLALVKTVHTLPFMKGVTRRVVVDVMQQILQRVYFNLLMETPGLELLYQGYQGWGATGFVEERKEKRSQVQLIQPNTEVEILRDDYHSTAFRDYPSQLLVYIKPLDESDWLNGIAVLIDHLTPLRIKDITMNELEVEPSQSESIQIDHKFSLYPENPQCDPDLP